MRLTRVWRARSVIATGVLLLTLTAACGGDSTGEPADQAATEPTATRAPEDNAVESAGQITIGGVTWELDPQQCSVFPGGVVSVSGFAVGDPDIGIVFDVFEPGKENLSVSGPDSNWSALSDAIEVQLDGNIVTGTATVGTSAGVFEDATFTFNCG